MLKWLKFVVEQLVLFMVRRQTWQAWRFKIFESARHFWIESGRPIWIRIESRTTVYPHKWSPISCRSSTGQRKTSVLPLTHKTADTEWLTNILKFVRRRLKSTVERWFSSPWLSSHCLRSFYTILHVLYTYLSTIISAIFLWHVT